MFVQILPNAMAPIIVFGIDNGGHCHSQRGGACLSRSRRPKRHQLGATMIGVGRESLRTAWYLSAIPGVAILITVLALNLVGEGLSDALNPKVR